MEEVDVWVNLRDDGEVDVVEEMQRVKGNVDAERAVLVLPLKLPRLDRAILVLGQKHNWIEDTGNSGGSDNLSRQGRVSAEGRASEGEERLTGSVDHAVGRSEIVE